MVTLNRIYTRTGDDGTTMLGDGSRVKKTDSRVRAYGTVDELNALLGLARSAGLEARHDAILARIQNDLFDLGSDLCTPISDKEQRGETKRGNRFPADRAARLEAEIDELQRDLEPLKSFILPGGVNGAAWLHLARTVARRAELEVLELSDRTATTPSALVFLNRVSDLLFVMARHANRGGGEVLWVPGGASAPKADEGGESDSGPAADASGSSSSTTE